uniref:Uncharacterized protein n=1 Tax=Timema monikensis TaxID=170555 RepID=A0A7R9HTB6_9NEOP|nr:unnamed protein product [Timema monikensis]
MTLHTPERDSNPNPHLIGKPVYYMSVALDHAANDADIEPPVIIVMAYSSPGNQTRQTIHVSALQPVTCANPVVQTYEYSIGQSEHCWLSSSEHQGAAQFVSCFGRLFILAFVVSRLDLHVVLLQAYIPALSIVATFLPSLVPLSWPLTLLYLWGGLAEESLLPVILAIFDNNFSGWVASVYSRDHKILADIAAHNQGLDGKFRVFSSPLLDAQPPHHKHSTQQEHAKFPITNGSLFTTVDGRHPVQEHQFPTYFLSLPVWSLLKANYKETKRYKNFSFIIFLTAYTIIQALCGRI